MGRAAILILAVPVSLSRGASWASARGSWRSAGLRLLARRDSRLSPRALFATAGGAALLWSRSSARARGGRDRVLTLAGVTTEQSGPTVWPVRGTPFNSPDRAPGSDRSWRLRGRVAALQIAAGQLAVEHAENDYLELLAEGGIGASGLVAVLAALALTRVLRGAVSHGDRLACGARHGCRGRPGGDRRPQRLRFQPADPLHALLCVGLVAVVLAVPASGANAASPAAVPAGRDSRGRAADAWAAPRVDPGPCCARHAAATRASGGPASSRPDRHLQRRPADVSAWLALAWLRVTTSRDEASALAEWAVVLDPAALPSALRRSRLGASTAR